MNRKFWCLFGVHEYKVIADGPYEKTRCGRVERTGSYYILNCSVCGKIKRKVVC